MLQSAIPILASLNAEDTIKFYTGKLVLPSIFWIIAGILSISAKI
jgi:hypothetical protein